MNKKHFERLISMTFSTFAYINSFLRFISKSAIINKFTIISLLNKTSEWNDLGTERNVITILNIEESKYLRNFKIEEYTKTINYTTISAY